MNDNTPTGAADSFIVERSLIGRIGFGLGAAFMFALMASWPWLFDRSESAPVFWLLGIVCSFLAVVGALYLYRMLSPQPFAIITPEGVEVWQWHRRVFVPWEENMELMSYRGELQLHRFKPGSSGLARILSVVLPKGGESLKLVDASCIPSAFEVSDAVRAFCPFPVAGD